MEGAMRVVPSAGRELKPCEQRFLDLTAELIEKTIDRGILGPVTTGSDDRYYGAYGGSFEDLMSIISEAMREGDEELIESHLRPITDAWNENQGRPPGELGGFYGTIYSMERNSKGQYLLELVGID